MKRRGLYIASKSIRVDSLHSYLECMKGKPKASFQKHFLPHLTLAYTCHGAERPYVAEVCRSLLRSGSQGSKRGKLTLIARMDRGHGGRGPISLTEEDDDNLLTDESCHESK